MKIFRSLVILIFLAFGSLAMQAQERPLVKVDVPFAFTVENVEMPAGTYTIWTTAYKAIMVQNADGLHTAFINAMEARKVQGSTESKLVFRQLGNEFFLSQVWEQGSEIHRDVRTGKRATVLAKNGNPSQLVVVLAKKADGQHS
jgi:hypothetical protein